MADLDRVAIRVSDGLRTTLSRISTLALGIVAITALIGTATFATGMWIFDGSRPAWIVIGGAICFAPTAAVVLAWVFVRAAIALVPTLAGNVRTLLGDSRSDANVLIDYDTGQSLNSGARSLGKLHIDLKKRRKELPALYAGVRAISSVPGLAAMALLGTLAVGASGTILLIGGLID